MKKFTIVCFFLINTITTFAQNWGGGVDDEFVHFGFSFQYISAEYKITKIPNWRDPYFDTEQGRLLTMPGKAISSPPTPGFGLGFVVNKRINNNLDFRLTPSLVFSDRVVRYEYEAAPPGFGTVNGVTSDYGPVIDKKIQATMFEFPAMIKVKSNRLGDLRAYWIGGLKYSMDIASKKRTFDDDQPAISKLLKSKRNYLSYEAGFGFDLYFEYFKMSPEIKLSYSKSDVLQHSNTAFATPISKMMLRQFTFSLFFE